MIESMKVEVASKEAEEENNKVQQTYGEFAGRTDGYSDKDGLIFIPSYESPDPTSLRAEQNMYTWSKTTIDGKEYDTFVFANSTKAAKYSDYYSGAFMVGNKVVEFSYNMYAEVKDQSVGPKFFTQIINSIEYSKEFKGE